MIDITKLSDDELAVLTYAIEIFHSHQGSGYKSITEKTLVRLKTLFSLEYDRRSLHWGAYQND